MLFWLFCIAGMAILALSGTIIVLLKLGVIVTKASEPPHLDYGNYSLDQAREVREEDQPTYRG